MGDLETENGEDAIGESGRNPTQQRRDEEGTEPVPVDEEWEDEQMSEVIPEDEDRGGGEALGNDETTRRAPMSDRVEGKLKEAEGKLTGDKEREAEGKGQEAFGKAKHAAFDAAEAVSKKLDD